MSDQVFETEPVGDSELAIKEDTNKALHILVEGKVQGVYYRASAAKKAQSLGLTGWVQNLEDGRVEIHAQGATDALEVLVQWCQKGPVLAKVSGLHHELAVLDQKMTDFEVRK
jgi:acylphosphatase